MNNPTSKAVTSENYVGTQAQPELNFVGHNFF